MLLQEEQYIIHWLTEYGALTKAQIVKLLKDKPPQTAERIIRGLKWDVMLHEISGGYYLGEDPMCQPDQRMILAVWVLLQFIDKVDPMAHYPATYPSQIFFLKEDIGYEIVVLYEGEQHLTRLLQPQEDLRYIFVLPHIRMAQELVLPSVPCLFATVDYNGQEVPEVRFFKEEGGDRSAACVPTPSVADRPGAPEPPYAYSASTTRSTESGASSRTCPPRADGRCWS